MAEKKGTKVVKKKPVKKVERKEKIDLLDLEGKVKEKIDLPNIFKNGYRPDLIKRAVLAAQANRRQPYGSNKMAGKRTSAHYHGSRHLPQDQRMMNREMSRIPRIHGDTATNMFMRARFAPHAVKGRRAHPPKSEKVWKQKINKKERLLTIKSAIAATGNLELVKERGHLFKGNLPLIVVDKIQELNKTKDVLKVFDKLGLKEDVERCKEKKIRAGKGKMRGRKYKRKKGPLLVITEDKGVLKSAKNIPGTDITKVENLNTELLSPGAHGARLTAWTKSAIQKLEELFKV